MRKSSITQELVNAFPPWARTRTSEQSPGFQLFNVLAQPMERMQKQLIRTGANTHLASANLDEIDWLYKIELPTHFEFEQDLTDPVIPVSVPPTCNGLSNGIWYPISVADPTTVEALWYDSVPDRTSLAETLSGVHMRDYELTELSVADISVSGVWEHHLDTGGEVWIECVGGVRYIKTVEGVLYRGRVIIDGINAQGQKDSEILIFPWDMKQKSNKQWLEINRVAAYDIEDTVDVIVTSANFNATDRLAPYNISMSENRKKVDTFYSISEDGHTFNRINYVSDEWQQLILGFVDKEAKERWELLDNDGDPISGIDMALQPFSDRAWVVNTDGTLYCYDTHGEMVSGVELLKDRTPGSDVQIDLEDKYVLLGEEIHFTPWHARPVQEISKWRLWYQIPSGQKYGMLNGVPVSYTSDFWVWGKTLSRNIGNAYSILADERGEYLIVLEAIMDDETTHLEKVLVPVNSKMPVGQISTGISSVLGIDFDGDQKLWLRTASAYYQLDFHTDIMLVDFDRKILYFQEPYETVRIEE